MLLQNLKPFPMFIGPPWITVALYRHIWLPRKEVVKRVEIGMRYLLIVTVRKVEKIKSKK